MVDGILIISLVCLGMFDDMFSSFGGDQTLDLGVQQYVAIPKLEIQPKHKDEEHRRTSILVLSQEVAGAGSTMNVPCPMNHNRKPQR
jgi:hypothetical protein